MAEDRRLLATAHDADLGVHVVSEFLYCPRAGVIAHEADHQDAGLDQRSIRLGFLPRYTVQAIAALIGKVTLILIAGIAVVILGILVAGFLSLTVWPLAVIACWLLLLVLVTGVPFGLGVLFLLTRRHAQAVGAKPEEPTFESDRAVSVEWWGLMAAGFELRVWPDAVSVSDWKLTGKPWRVLVRGGTYIPVVLQRSDNRKLFKKHFARLSAYCEMLSDSASGDSPYGVILYAGSNDAVAIPNTKQARQALGDGVRGLRHVLSVLKGGLAPNAPAGDRLCRECPHGILRQYSQASVREGDPKPNLVGIGKARYHSDCGDRFRWTAPHNSAYELGVLHEEP